MICWLCLAVLVCNQTLLASGGFLPGRAGLQERQRGFPAGAGAILDVVPQSPAQLLGSRGLLLLLRCSAVADQRAADQPPAGCAWSLLHAGQQVGLLLKGVTKIILKDATMQK